ncbi:MAG: NADH:flavin oxidoreductase [Vallitalea sp.]|jgi:2,4-dienoyl-CoA reductase-like NADH-dependent reductase (Old Yellow Enzyme family)|nr:NADH:flavin oxidoreductase [Vallitalea sp.]
MNLENLQVFKALELRNMTIKNRVIRSATHSMLGNLDGTISADELKMYDELASNEIGLIIAGQFFVSKDGIVAPSSNELINDDHVKYAKKIKEIVEPNDTKVIAQINHAGIQAYSQDPFGPSEFELEDGRVAREMTIDEITRVKSDFVEAAVRAQKSRMDGVQLHAAHGYLLCEFLKPSINKRTDNYGGSSENRFRIVREILEEIKEACGEAYPVFIKIDSNDLIETATYNDDLDYMMFQLEALGIEAVEFSGSDFATKKYSDHNYFLDRALEIKGDRNIATMVVGGVRNFNDMETVLISGIDMVSLSRPFITEPDLITRLKKGQEKSRCVSCSKCSTVGRKRCILNTF